VAVEPGRLRAGDTATLGLRPEHLSLAPDGPLGAEVTFVERLGTTSLLHAPGFLGGPLVVEVRGMETPEPGPLTVAPDLARARIFDSSGLLATPG
jgi:multiple sugar transport system ATP-binding protein